MKSVTFYVIIDMLMKEQIINVRAVLPNKVSDNSTIVFENGKIIFVGSEKSDGIKTFDGQGMYLLPGFIDIHCHGGANYDFMDASLEEIECIFRYHLMHGTTTLIPTTMTDDWENIRSALDRLRDFYKTGRPSSLYGAHLEGPWLSPRQCGAQEAGKMSNPSISGLNRLLRDYPFIKRISVAPELECGMEVGRAGRLKGLVMSIAHTDADFETVIEASENGYTLMTHLYSGMSGITRKNAYRTAGAVEAGLYCDELFVEIIADGKHLPAGLLKLIFKCKGPDKICLITDAMRASGLREGSVSVLGRKNGGVSVIVEDGVAKMPDRQNFAGSVATADRLVRTMLSAGIDIVSVSKMASATPAKAMNLSDRGSIEIGKRADFVLMDEKFQPRAVISGGKIEYVKN